MAKYTEIWNDFQITSPTFLDGHLEPEQYSIIKWQDYDPPFEAIDWETGEKKMVSRSSFVIGDLVWDDDEWGFKFQSCGMRYFEHRIDGLEEWIMKFCDERKEWYLEQEKKKEREFWGE